MVIETALSALVGLLGTGLTTYSNYKMKQLEQETKLKVMEAETKQMVAEAEANIKVAQTNADIAIEASEAESFRESMSSNRDQLPSDWLTALLQIDGWPKYFMVPLVWLLTLVMGIGDVINHLMRPLLTLYTLGIASVVTYKCYGLVEVADPALAWQGWQEASQVIMLLAVVMVTWWFGDRRVAKHLMHQQKNGG